MGNQLNPQQIRSNLSQYQCDLSSYQLAPSNSQPSTQQDNTLFTWQHKTTPQRLIEKKYFLRTWLQFHQLLEMFALRYNDPFIVSAKYLNLNSSAIENLNTSSVFPQTWISIFYEETLINLSCFDEIPQQDGAYFLVQTLKAFQKLTQKTKSLFEVKQEMFHITHSKQLKLWLSECVWQSKALESVRHLSTESQMIHQILSIIQRNICFCTQSQKNITLKDKNHIQPIVIEELMKKAPQTFSEAISLVLRHLESDQVQVGTQMTCLKNLSHDQIRKIFEQSTRDKNNKVYRNSGNSILTVQNQKLTSHQPIHLNQFQSMHFNQFQYQSLPINHLNQVDSEMNKRLQSNSSVGNFERQERGFRNGASMRVSRDKSNKKSGLSLVKKDNEQQSDKRRNHNSLLVIQPRPNSSLNQQSTISALRTNDGHPPLSRNVSFTNINSTDQSQSPQVNPFASNKKSMVKRGNSFLGGHQSKGITITNRQDSSKKYINTNIVIGTNQDNMKGNNGSLNSSQNDRVVLRLNNNEKRSEVYNQQLNISVGNFPHPLYSNNSMITSNNQHQIMPSQTFSSNMSFDPLLPNQSLTRFHKEFVSNSHVNSSRQQFYEIPKIYVHSPKAKHKIFKTNSFEHQIPNYQTAYPMERQILNNRNGLTSQKYINHDIVSDSVEQSSSQKSLTQNPQLDQYQSYIHQNESVFTHPVLYQYITNLTNAQPIHNQRPKKVKPYIDYLSNVKISQSLDYHTAQKIFQSTNQQSPQPQKLQNNKDLNPHHYSINDFPTIEEIQENPNDEQYDKENVSFVPIYLNLAPQPNIPHCPPSSVRRGYEESVVVEYKKFYDDTNRSNNSPNKHYFSPLKKNNMLMNQAEEMASNQEKKKYATANNWQTSPSKPLIQRPTSVHQVIYQGNQVNQANQLNQVNQLNQTYEQRNHSPSPMSKIIYRGEKPSINPLLMQDIQKMRQNRMY